MNKLSSNNNGLINFAEFLKFCEDNNIKSQRHFAKFRKSNPTGLPSTPRKTYKSEWKGWFPITGNKYGEKKDFVSFEKFVDFCQRHNIKTSAKFYSLEKPFDIPSNPNLIYKKEWKGWAYITKSGGKTRWLPFKEARSYMHTQNLTARTGERGWLQWEKNGNRPHNIPANPYTVYGKQWTNWRDFLGTNWVKYPKSKIYAIASRIRKRRDWSRKGMAKYGIDKPGSIPLTIKNAYPKDWEGIKNFLGTRAVPYKEFVEFLLVNNIMCQMELTEFLKASPQKGIKSKPSYYYPDKWEGWVTFRKRFK